MTMPSPSFLYDAGYWRRVFQLNPASPGNSLENMPFAPGDAAAGVENELQTAVIGNSTTVDLPISIRESDFFKNIHKRVHTGESTGKLSSELEKYLDDGPGVWENSWVRFPRQLLSRYAQQVLKIDLLSDKRCPESGQRTDVSRFVYSHHQEEWLRIPVSYLIKLSMADVIGRSGRKIPRIQTIGEKLMKHFLSDNTSPETYSFQPVRLCLKTGMGQASARETLIRYLLTHLLVEYGNQQFQLRLNGQETQIYFAPHPPHRLRQLNDLIPDAVYRQLFMNPCLSGWDQGEEKHQYMHLCHQVLSRSQLNAVTKLKDAGIITSNLVVLPNMSNISLANNGTHISLSSEKMSRMMADPSSGFGPVEEKYFGDLVIKIVEHFLPLFVNSYSADPYRMDFWDFHPEKALGFLAHELDYTHLRMLWRRWKKKAKLKTFGYPMTPMGPLKLDKILSRIFGLQGDLVTDFRLVDYLVCLLSTEQSPALNGQEGSDVRLKQNLANMGVFDQRMALYLFYRLRQYQSMGFSGFEGRYYSLFHRFLKDMGPAVGLQQLITAFACQSIIDQKIIHRHIPDSPVVESERRQILFGAAIGIPTFFVQKQTPNVWMQRILKEVEHTRQSRRYPGYIRIHNREFQKALVKILRKDAAGLIEMMQMKEALDDLENRILDPEHHAASGRLTRDILDHAGAKTPFKLSGSEFNQAAETFYRTTLRKQHLEEALTVLSETCKHLDHADTHGELGKAVSQAIHQRPVAEFLAGVRDDVLNDQIRIDELTSLIQVLILLAGPEMIEKESSLT
ncbi:MAG: hypothetical protein V1844_13485 [Pseudomonadota bacterium]